MSKPKAKPAVKVAAKKVKPAKKSQPQKKAVPSVSAKKAAKKSRPSASKATARPASGVKSIAKKNSKNLANKSKSMSKNETQKAKSKPKIPLKSKAPAGKAKNAAPKTAEKKGANKSAASPASKAVKQTAKPVPGAAKAASKKSTVQAAKEIKPNIEVMQKNDLPKLSTIQTTHSFTKQKVQPAPSTAKELNADGSEKARYSDKELKEFKELIITKIDNAKSEYALLQQQINNANDHGTDDTGGTFKMLEDGSETLAKEEAAQLAARQRKFIEQLESALIRIQNKTYGICRVTGRLIPKERLRAVPHTTQSIEAKLMQYKDQ